MFIELQIQALSDSCKRHKNFSDKRIAFSKESYGISEEKHTRADMISVIRIYLLYLQTVLITAGPAVTI